MRVLLPYPRLYASRSALQHVDLKRAMSCFSCFCMTWSVNWNMDGADIVFACVPCAAGTWKGELGNVACRRCASGSTSPKGSVSESQCVQWVSTILHCVSVSCLLRGLEHSLRIMSLRLSLSTTSGVRIFPPHPTRVHFHNMVTISGGVRHTGCDMLFLSASFAFECSDASTLLCRGIVTMSTCLSRAHRTQQRT